MQHHGRIIVEWDYIDVFRPNCSHASGWGHGSIGRSWILPCRLIPRSPWISIGGDLAGFDECKNIGNWNTCAFVFLCSFVKHVNTYMYIKKNKVRYLGQASGIDHAPNHW
jgi:hypothetical protein